MTLTVLQIIPALGTGGAEQAVVDVAAGLVARGDRALVVSSGGRRVREIEACGATHVFKDVQTKNPIKIIQNAFWLAELIRREKVDIVHARSRAPAWSARIACRLAGCRFVTTFHAAYKYSNEIKFTYNSVMASADRVIAISSFIAEHVHDRYGVPQTRLRVVNRGVNMDVFDPSTVSEERKAAIRDAARIGSEEQVILLPARLSPIKGHAHFIRVMARLLRENGDVPTCLIVGDDQGREAYRNSLLELISRTHLDHRIHLFGPCADMPAAYAISSLVVVPSVVPEGFGRVPVEAMAMGVPVIASSLGAMCDTVEKHTGWLVPPDDEMAWAEAIEEALALGAKERAVMAQGARNHVERRFNQKVMVADTLAVYDELST